MGLSSLPDHTDHGRLRFVAASLPPETTKHASNVAADMRSSALPPPAKLHPASSPPRQRTSRPPKPPRPGPSLLEHWRSIQLARDRELSQLKLHDTWDAIFQKYSVIPLEVDDELDWTCEKVVVDRGAIRKLATREFAEGQPDELDDIVEDNEEDDTIGPHNAHFSDDEDELGDWDDRSGLDPQYRKPLSPLPRTAKDDEDLRSFLAMEEAARAQLSDHDDMDSSREDEEDSESDGIDLTTFGLEDEALNNDPFMSAAPLPSISSLTLASSPVRPTRADPESTFESPPYSAHATSSLASRTSSVSSSTFNTSTTSKDSSQTTSPPLHDQTQTSSRSNNPSPSSTPPHVFQNRCVRFDVTSSPAERSTSTASPASIPPASRSPHHDSPPSSPRPSKWKGKERMLGERPSDPIPAAIPARSRPLQSRPRMPPPSVPIVVTDRPYSPAIISRASVEPRSRSRLPANSPTLPSSSSSSRPTSSSPPRWTIATGLSSPLADQTLSDPPELLPHSSHSSPHGSWEEEATLSDSDSGDDEYEHERSWEEDMDDDESDDLESVLSGNSEEEEDEAVDDVPNLQPALRPAQNGLMTPSVSGESVASQSDASDDEEEDSLDLSTWPDVTLDRTRDVGHSSPHAAMTPDMTPRSPNIIFGRAGEEIIVVDDDSDDSPASSAAATPGERRRPMTKLTRPTPTRLAMSMTPQRFPAPPRDPTKYAMRIQYNGNYEPLACDGCAAAGGTRAQYAVYCHGRMSDDMCRNGHPTPSFLERALTSMKSRDATPMNRTLSTTLRRQREAPDLSKTPLGRTIRRSAPREQPRAEAPRQSCESLAPQPHECGSHRGPACRLEVVVPLPYVRKFTPESEASSEASSEPVSSPLRDRHRPFLRMSHPSAKRDIPTAPNPTPPPSSSAPTDDDSSPPPPSSPPATSLLDMVPTSPSTSPISTPSRSPARSLARPEPLSASVANASFRLPKLPPGTARKAHRQTDRERMPPPPIPAASASGRAPGYSPIPIMRATPRKAGSGSDDEGSSRKHRERGAPYVLERSSLVPTPKRDDRERSASVAYSPIPVVHASPTTPQKRRAAWDAEEEEHPPEPYIVVVQPYSRSHSRARATTPRKAPSSPASASSMYRTKSMTPSRSTSGVAQPRSSAPAPAPQTTPRKKYRANLDRVDRTTPTSYSDADDNWGIGEDVGDEARYWREASVVTPVRSEL